MSLIVDFCTHAAAKYAVMHWHYSRTMPIGKLVKIGVWENGRFIGAIIYGRGASKDYGKRFGVESVEVCELVRVALTGHDAPVTQLVSTSLRLLKQTSPGLRIVVSFADTAQGHRGTIYQAGNWYYLGQTTPSSEYLYRGKWVHLRVMTAPPSFSGARSLPEVDAGMSYSQLRQSLPKRETATKHRYAYPLDKKMRRRLESMKQPYPAVQVSEARHHTSGVEG